MPGRPARGAVRIDAAKAVTAAAAVGAAAASRPAGREALAPDAVLHLRQGAAGEGLPARHHFVEDHAQRPDIVGGLGRAAGEHLGREDWRVPVCRVPNRSARVVMASGPGGRLTP